MKPATAFLGMTVAAVLFAAPACLAEAPRADIRGAALGMTLADAVGALSQGGAVCGRGVFDSHRCDYDSDTWIHLHVVGPGKIVEAIRYVYPALRDPERFAAFRQKVVQRFGLSAVDNRARYVTPHGAFVTITDGEIDLEASTLPPPPPSPEPVL